MTSKFTGRLHTHSSASRLDQLAREQAAAAPSKVSQITRRFQEEKRLQRREERSKLVSESRFASTARSEPAHSLPPPSSRAPARNPAASRSVDEQGFMREQIASDRRRLLEQWRKAKADEMKKAKTSQRPVFKVRHVEPREIYTRPSASVSQNTSKAHESKIEYQRPVTRSQTKQVRGLQPSKSASFLPQPAPREPPAFNFRIKKWSSQSKFTFTATLSEQPFATECIVETKYEDFCDRLFAAAAPEPEAPAVKAKNSLIDTIKNSASYRRSRSGVYKVDLQSSIIEFDSCKSDEASNARIDEMATKLSAVVAIENVPAEENKENEPVRREELRTEVEIVVEHITEPKKEEAVAVAEPEDPRALDLAFDFESVPLESRDVKYYRSLVKNRTRLLNDYSANWLGVCEKRSEGEFGPPDDVQGDIRSACGLAQLLIDERFDQFSDLIDQCEASSKRPPDSVPVDEDVKLVLCSDLQGFWDMVEFQVKDVEKKFAYLKLLKEHDYIAENIPVQLLNPTTKAAPAKKKFIKPFVAKKKPTESTSETAEDPKPTAEAKKAPARSKFAEFRAKMKQGGAQEPAAEPPVSATEDAKILPLTSLDCEILLEQTMNKPKEAPAIETRPPLMALDDPFKASPAAAPKPKKVRSRPSDLIIFDSPAGAHKPSSRVFRCQEIAESSCETSAVVAPGIVVQPCSPMVTLSRGNSEDKENAVGSEDFFSFTVNPITWRQNQPAAATTPKFNAKTTSSLLGSSRAAGKSPLTPRLANSNADSRDSMGGAPLINSPLLKMVYISSQGKRASLSKNAAAN